MTVREFKAWFEGYLDGLGEYDGYIPVDEDLLRKKIAELEEPDPYRNPFRGGPSDE